MEETEVLNAVKAELERAESFMESKISIERAAAYDYYHGKLFGNEVEGRSQVVSADVAQAVDSAVPAIVKIFVSGDKAVEFTPRGPEDVKSAEQATLAANYVFFTQNNGYALAHDFIKDGLLQKTGVFKWKWVEPTYAEQKYSGVDPLTLQILATNPDIEVVSIKPEETEEGGPETFDVVVKERKEAGKVEVCVPPPEEILISPDAEGMDVMKMPFIAHTPLLTKSDLVELGIAPDVIESLPQGDTGTLFADELIARKDRTDSDATLLDDKPHNPVYRYNECYLKLDVDGDGIAELRKICTVGDTVLMNETVDHIPLAIWTPKVMPHEVVGMSLADEVMDIQLLKSTIWRQALDNLYLTNAPRLFAQGDVNLDDVLTVKPGGVIRGEMGSQLTPIAVPFTAGNAFQMLEYADQEEEVRTGISRLFQGIDPQSINKTATGVNALINQANARVELMARNAAEFGFKPLFKGILYLLSKHQQQALMVRLSNNFVPIDPETWSKEYDMSCNVGLGMGTKDQQLMQLQSLGQDLAMIMQSPFAQQLIDAKKIFNYEQKKIELMGFKDVATFLNDPEGQPPPQPQKPPEIQKAEMQIQADKEKFAAESQMKAVEMEQEGQLQMQKAQIDAEVARYKAELDAQVKIQVEQMRAQMEHERELRRVEVDGMVGMKQAENAGKGGATIQIEDREGSLKNASQQLTGHTEVMAQGLSMMAQAVADLKEAMSRPKQIVRGKDGRAIGVQ